MYIYTYIYTYILIMHIYIYKYICVCMYVCMYIYVCVRFTLTLTLVVTKAKFNMICGLYLSMSIPAMVFAIQNIDVVLKIHGYFIIFWCSKSSDIELCTVLCRILSSCLALSRHSSYAYP